MLPDKALHSRQGLAPAVSQVVLPQLNRDCSAPRHRQKIPGVLPPFQSWPVSHGTCAMIYLCSQSLPCCLQTCCYSSSLTGKSSVLHMMCVPIRGFPIDLSAVQEILQLQDGQPQGSLKTIGMSLCQPTWRRIMHTCKVFRVSISLFVGGCSAHL